jgi:putative membrane protein
MPGRILHLKMARVRAKHLTALVASSAFILAALPAVAQQQTAPTAPTVPYGYGPMMWGWGWQPFMMIGPIFGLLIVIGVLAIFVGLVRWATGSHPLHGRRYHMQGTCPYCGKGARSALDVLEERLARGEIDKAEFEDKRKLLSH